VTFTPVVAVFALAILEGGLVALPRRDALACVARLCSPLWALLLPGSIVVGTFGVIAWPSTASALVILAGVATPLLTVIAMVAVSRGRRVALLATAIALGVLCVAAGGWFGQLSATLLSALGCMTLGVGLARLVPHRWVLVGAVCMCVVDVTLLAQGVGQAATVLMNHATLHVHGHGPAFDRAAIGPIATDYPDLVLAAVLGGFLAGDQRQRRAALLVTALAGAYGMLLPVAGTLPATVPLALVFVVCRPGRRRPLAVTWTGRFPRPRLASSTLSQYIKKTVRTGPCDCCPHAAAAGSAAMRWTIRWRPRASPGLPISPLWPIEPLVSLETLVGLERQHHRRTEPVGEGQHLLAGVS
jgi:hypothetical protein